MTGSIDGSLEGVVAAQTAIGHVDGRAGIAIVRGYPLADIARRCSYEEVAHLVLHGELPGSKKSREDFEARLNAHATVDAESYALATALGARLEPADALSAAIALADDAHARSLDAVARCERILARTPAICAAVRGYAPPDPYASYAARSLSALGASVPDTPSLRAFEVLLSLESEHGLSASTFACRVAASSGAGAGVCLAAAVATLSGDRHGGATANALALLERVEASGDPAEYVRRAHANKERLPGFGHRIYKVPDPRVPPLRDAAACIASPRRIAVAEAMRVAAEPLFGPKGVHANIDLYGAALLDALGVSRENFVAAFALGVVSGWLAHWCEQRQRGRLIRPDSLYVGPPVRAVP